MKIQSKILLMLSTVLLLVIVAVYKNYSNHKDNYNKFVQYTIDNAINNIKTDIEKSDIVIDKILTDKYDLYKQIHKDVVKQLKNNPNTSLENLKIETDKLFPSGLIESHFYLINKNYVIYDTTFKEDMNLNMSNFLGAKEYIDNARKNETKVSIANPSFDVLYKKYRIYSYALLDKEKQIVLEMGFFDKVTSEIKDTLYKFNIEDSIIKEVDFYVDYGKYTINLSKHKEITGITKQEFIQKNIKSKDETLIKVREVVSNKKPISFDKKEGEKTFRTVYKLIGTSNISDNKLKSHVLKVKLDVTQFEDKLELFKKELYFTFLIAFIFTILVFLFLRKSFVSPLNHILSKVSSWEIIDSKDILYSKNEFSKLAHEFNKTFERQQELNNTLEERVKIEVAKNIKKEKQLIEQSKMANLGAMIGNIAHQWRQPLSLISSIAFATKFNLKSHTEQKDIELVNDDMNMIIDKTKYLSDSINTFRDFLREDKGTQEVILEERIDIALKVVNLALKDNHIKLMNNIDYSKETKIIMPIGELTEVVINIINNSKDAILENKIRKPWVKLDLITNDTNALIIIEDNAGGIPKDIVPKIFDEYFTTKGNEGTGLGLHMSKRIITESLNGKLYTENSEHGAKFYIEIPIK